MPYRDSDFEELDPREYPDPDSGPDGTVLIPCPYCAEPVYEEAQFCPRCENYISREDAPLRKPLWIVATIILCLAVLIYLLTVGL